MIIGSRDFDTKNNAYIMGILNVTPDSFSDGGRFNSVDKALAHAEQMIEEGADIIDVGGESTRPGYIQISDSEEIERTAGVISALKERFDTVISLDTYKSGVAAAGIAAGADIINDIWGLKYDKNMADVIAENNVACCLMHNRNLDAMTGVVNAEGAVAAGCGCSSGHCGSVIDDVVNDLRETLFTARRAGISDDRIMIDPGIGFGKTYEMNLEVLRNLSKLNEFRLPILLGTSRKSVIGLTLDIPAQERVVGTTTTTVMGYLAGCRFFRVHDVKENVQALKMTMAVMN